MKTPINQRILYSFLFSLLLLNNTYGQWYQIPSNTNNHLLAISNPSENIIYIGGTNGTIAKSSDKGISWTSLNNTLITDFYGSHFINESEGYFVGNNGYILKTTNGGTNWSSIQTNSNHFLRGISFINPSTGFVGGRSGSLTEGIMYRTDNGGSTWTQVNSTFNSISHITFVNSSVGFACGSEGKIYKTENGGDNWTSNQVLTTNELIVRIFFTDVNNGYFTTDQGKIYKSVNGGNTWTLTSTFSNIFLSSVHFLNNDLGFCLGGNVSQNSGFIMTSTNQGLSWTSQATQTPRLFHMTFMDRNNGIAVGLNGTILKYSGISRPTINGNAFCPGSSISISFQTFGVYNNGNTFTAELFNPTNNTSIILGSVAGTSGNTINGTIPNNISQAENYRIRIRSSLPADIGPDNGSDISIGLPQLSSISGPTSVCNGIQGIEYSVNGSPTSTYLWTVPAGAQIVSGQNTKKIIVNFSGTTGNITVKETNSNGCSGPVSSIKINILSLPSSPSITGLESVCENSINVGYSVPLSQGFTYHWNISEGAGIVSGQNTSSIKVNFSNIDATISLIRTNQNGCSSVVSKKQVTINALPQVVLTTSKTTICSGEIISLTASGGTTYTWTGATPNNIDKSMATAKPGYSTTISVTGKGENGCSKKISEDITVNPTPKLTVTPPSAVICKGSNQSVNISVIGANEYVWSGGTITGISGNNVNVNPVVSTTYTVTGISLEGCTSQSKTTVFVNSPKTPTITSTCNSLKANSTEQVTYQWNLNGQPIPGATNADFLPQNCGNYSVTTTNTSGCSAISTQILVIGTNNNIAKMNYSQISENNSGLTIYPNPNNGTFSIEVSLKLQVINMNGEVIYEKAINDFSELDKIQIETTAGLYQLQIISGESIISKKIIIQN